MSSSVWHPGRCNQQCDAYNQETQNIMMDDKQPRMILKRREAISPIVVVVAVLWTVVFHAGILGLVALGTWHKQETIEKTIEPKMLEFENVELLALGEKKPPEALPRIANPAKRTKKPDKVTINKNPKVPTIKPKKKKDEPKEVDDKPSKNMLDALDSLHNPDRPTNTDTPAGGKAGIVGGTLSDAAMASLMNTYQAKLLIAFRKRRTVPTTLTDSQVKQFDKKAEIYIRLSKTGHIVKYKWVKKSGNAQYDDSIETTVKKFMVQFGAQKLPLPQQAEVKQEVLKKGLRLTGR